MASVITGASPLAAVSASMSSASVSTTARPARLGLETCAPAPPGLEPFALSTASLARFAGASDMATPSTRSELAMLFRGHSQRGLPRFSPLLRRGERSGRTCRDSFPAIEVEWEHDYKAILYHFQPSARGHPPSLCLTAWSPAARVPDSHRLRRRRRLEFPGLPGPPARHAVTRLVAQRGSGQPRPLLRSRRRPPRRGSARAPAPRAAAP